MLFVNSTNLGPANRRRTDGAAFLSDEWMDLYKHAVSEADRLGIEFGVNLSGGWCMGGPWIEPQDSGRWYLQSRLLVTGPQKFSGRLPLPGARDGYDRVFNPPGFRDYIDLPLEKLDYRDTCVVAFRDNTGDISRDDAGLSARFADRERLRLLPAKANRRDATNHTIAQELSGPWTVKFDPVWGGPAQIEFASLEDWTKRAEAGIKHYSGSAFYLKRFEYKPTSTPASAPAPASGAAAPTVNRKQETANSPAPAAARIALDLGIVKNIAGVRLNGRDHGTVWTAPWRVDITDSLLPGDNMLEIEVVNEWRNRLIGDASLPAEKRLTCTNIPIDPKSPLLPSGLLGPVTIRSLAQSQ